MARSNKYQGHWQVFDKAWFKRNQPKLLSWINGSWLKRKLARYALRIDVKEDLAEISSSYYTIDLPSGEKQSTFRTHDKYSKRVYYALLPIWWMLHFIDWIFLDRLVPKFSFGFATLTAYPNAGTTMPMDQYNQSAEVSSVAWATIHDRTSATVIASDQYIYTSIQSGLYSDWKTFNRGFYAFDTSAIGSSSTVGASTFSVYGFQYSDSLSLSAPASAFEVATSTFSGNSVHDYPTYGSSVGSIAYASFSTAGYNDITIDTSAVSKTSTTKLASLINCDLNNSEPTWTVYGQLLYYVYSADYTGTSNDPKLVVTYSLPTVYKPSAIILA